MVMWLCRRCMSLLSFSGVVGVGWGGTSFLATEDTEGRGERQRQLLLTTEDTEGHGERQRQLQLLLSTEGH